VIAGSNIPTPNGRIRGDSDVTMEIWTPAVEVAPVRNLRVTFPDATQAWFVPRSMVEGPNAPAPSLRSIFDRPRHAHLFRDRGEPSKGRFCNCMECLGCETINTRKLHAHRLLDGVTSFRL
jgi:glycine betaine/proline transport system substrate-binding protein